MKPVCQNHCLTLIDCLLICRQVRNYFLSILLTATALFHSYRTHHSSLTFLPSTSSGSRIFYWMEFVLKRKLVVLITEFSSAYYCVIFSKLFFWKSQSICTQNKISLLSKDSKRSCVWVGYRSGPCVWTDQKYLIAEPPTVISPSKITLKGRRIDAAFISVPSINYSPKFCSLTTSLINSSGMFLSILILSAEFRIKQEIISE